MPFERGSGDGLVLLFGVAALAFGALSGRWWAVLIPVLLTTVAVAAGVECSSSDQPQALMLAGTLVGVSMHRRRRPLGSTPVASSCASPDALRERRAA